MKIAYKMFLAACLATTTAYAQTDVATSNTGSNYLGGSGSWLRFPTGGNPTSIIEGWGLILTGNNLRPVKIHNASLLVGYESTQQDFGINNALIYGSVGIGTNQPGAKLDVNGGDIRVSGNLLVSSGNATGGGIKLADDGDIVDLNDGWATHRFSYGLRLTNGNATGLPVIQLANGVGPNSTYFNAGNVGIGITDPKRPLDVNGDIMLRNYENVDGAGASIFFTPYGDWYQNGPRIKSQLKFAAANASKANLVLSSYSNGYKNELTLDDGNVQIGTNGNTGNLSVNGTIHTREVKVDTQNFPDFVFKPTYTLPSLTEVKNFIDQKGHLPGMPSEAEAIKDGISLGEMNKKLLQKVEELTLYLIEKDKEIKQIKSQFKTLLRSKASKR